MSDKLSGITHPDDNHDRPWWGLPCTVTPCFGARLVQEGIIKYFKKGSAHITFKRLELIDRINDIIARYFPSVLSA